MANKMTVALTREQYQEIIKTMRTGGADFRANNSIATALVLEANLGLRIGDILKLTLDSFVKDGNRYRLNIVEQKTKKKRFFTVPDEVYSFLIAYYKENHIAPDELLFPFTDRSIQLYLEKVCNYLDYKHIGTHSFRKYFATEMLVNNNYNIVLVQKLLQHSSPAITQRYIGISSEEMENALKRHIVLL